MSMYHTREEEAVSDNPQLEQAGSRSPEERGEEGWDPCDGRLSGWSWPGCLRCHPLAQHARGILQGLQGNGEARRAQVR